jgi:hypothetical protein
MRGRWIAAAVAVVLLAGTGRAWACVPQPGIVVQPRSSAPAGSQVTVTGQAFGDSRVEIRWNATDGELLGAVPGPNFTADIAIPQAPPGLYTLIAIMREPDGAVANTARAPFQVLEAGAPEMSAAAPQDRAQTSPVPSSVPAEPSLSRATAALVLALLAVVLASAALLRSFRQRTGKAESVPNAGD